MSAVANYYRLIGSRPRKGESLFLCSWFVFVPRGGVCFCVAMVSLWESRKGRLFFAIPKGALLGLYRYMLYIELAPVG